MHNLRAPLLSRYLTRAAAWACGVPLSSPQPPESRHLGYAERLSKFFAWRVLNMSISGPGRTGS